MSEMRLRIPIQTIIMQPIISKSIVRTVKEPKKTRDLKKLKLIVNWT